MMGSNVVRCLVFNSCLTIFSSSIKGKRRGLGACDNLADDKLLIDSALRPTVVILSFTVGNI